ncbi:MAG: hypothetical protein WD118_11035 [Phycisphaeraceae bacterium]
MTRPSHRDVVATVLEQHGQTFTEELGSGGVKDTPAALFRLLCFAHLASARIRHDIAVDATRALFKQGWTTPQKMAAATWTQRTRTLNKAGYARYDESTSERLGYNADLLIDRYGGDLRRLRDEAEHDPTEERQRLKAFKGIGDVGVDIFFREAQVVWDELYPFADRVALRCAGSLDLPDDPKALERLVEGDRHKFARLVSALVRIELQKQHEQVRRAAA